MAGGMIGGLSGGTGGRIAKELNVLAGQAVEEGTATYTTVTYDSDMR